MAASKQDIINQLKKDILLLGGYKRVAGDHTINSGLQKIAQAFPNEKFPVGAIHEFISTSAETVAATNGFMAGLLSGLMKNGGVCVWIGTERTVFPPALTRFGVAPDRIIFIDLHKEKEALWVMEEVLKCEGFAAVIGEIQQISFTASRRLQLAVEQSRVTGFILRKKQTSLNAIACVARWQITSLQSVLPGDMPGVGFPHWKVELLKVRNGKPGVWDVEWIADRFSIRIAQNIPASPFIPQVETRKAG
jgi:protein ImuA